MLLHVVLYISFNLAMLHVVAQILALIYSYLNVYRTEYVQYISVQFNSLALSSAVMVEPK